MCQDYTPRNAMSTEWNISEHEFPAGDSPSAQLRFALRYASLAPSNRNSQPWRFIQSGHGVVVLADRSRAVSVVDPFDRELTISCGAALMNLRVAMAYFGMRARVETFPAQAGPDVLAHVTLQPEAHVEDRLAALFPALTARATNRSAFASEAVPRPVQAALIEQAALEGIELVILDSADGRSVMSTLVEQANGVLLADPRYRRELAVWSHPQRVYDGIPNSPLGLPRVMDFAEPLGGMETSASAVAREVVDEEKRKVNAAPLIACFCSRGDAREDWLRAGQGLERVLLEANLRALDASFFNQVLEVGDTRAALRGFLGGRMHPQILARFGKGEAVGHTPRRPLHHAMR